MTPVVTVSIEGLDELKRKLASMVNGDHPNCRCLVEGGFMMRDEVIDEESTARPVSQTITTTGLNGAPFTQTVTASPYVPNDRVYFIDQKAFTRRFEARVTEPIKFSFGPYVPLSDSVPDFQPKAPPLPKKHVRRFREELE